MLPTLPPLMLAYILITLSIALSLLEILEDSISRSIFDKAFTKRYPIIFSTSENLSSTILLISACTKGLVAIILYTLLSVIFNSLDISLGGYPLETYSATNWALQLKM